MGKTFSEELAAKAEEMRLIREAKQLIDESRRQALNEMFKGTQLVLKKSNAAKAAKEIKAQAEKAKNSIKSVLPTINIPDVQIPKPNFNLLKFFHLKEFKTLQFGEIPNFSLSLPSPFDINLIPDIRLGDLPSFDLEFLKIHLAPLGWGVKLNMLPNISLRAILARLGQIPGISFPSILKDLEWLLRVDFKLVPKFPTQWLDIELSSITIPALNIPDLNFPELPKFNLPNINLHAIDIPELNMPKLWKIPGFDRVLKLLFELFDVADIGIIIGELGIEVLKEFLSTALPIIGQVVSGYKAAKELGQAAVDAHKALKVTKQAQFLLPGDPYNAAKAVQKLLTERAGSHLATGAVKSIQFATSTAGLFADLGAGTGPAIAAAAAIEQMCQKIFEVSLEYKRARAANALLKNPGETLCSSIFNASPLLGCYFLSCATTSDIILILTKDMSTLSDWMTDVERNKRTYIDPLLKTATSFIQQSRYELIPLRQNKGIFSEKSITDKLFLFFKQKLGFAPKPKPMVGFGSDTYYQNH